MTSREGLESYNRAPRQNSGRIIKDEDPLDRWPGWESAPEFLIDMVKKNSFVQNANFDMKGFMEQVIRELHMTKAEQKKYLRPDPVPYAYRANYQYLKENVPRLNANPTGLTIEQILALDRHFHRTYVDNNVFAQMCQRFGCTSYMSGKKWEIKHHKLTNYDWPKFSHDFKSLGFIQVGPEGVKDVGFGWGMAYEIPFTTIDMAAGGTYDPDYWAVFFLSQQMGIFGDERGWLGGAGRNTTGKGAPDLTGLLNDADADNVTCPATDLGYSSGKVDFEDVFIDTLSAFKTNAVYGASQRNNCFVTTAGIASETAVHDSTYLHKTLYEDINSKWMNAGRLGAWYVSDNIVSTALGSMTKATQAAYMLKMSPNYIKRTVVYPLQRKILSEKFKTYPDDIAFAYITGDIIQVYDGNAVIHCAASTSAAKAQYRGWEMNGLFMGGGAAGYRDVGPTVK